MYLHTHQPGYDKILQSVNFNVFYLFYKEILFLFITEDILVKLCFFILKFDKVIHSFYCLNFIL